MRNLEVSLTLDTVFLKRSLINGLSLDTASTRRVQTLSLSLQAGSTLITGGGKTKQASKVQFCCN